MAIIRGTRRPDRLNGTDNADFIFGFAGDDVVFAGAGNDYVDGGDGNDALDGGDGNDVLIGGLGSDDIRGGKGDDLLVDSHLGAFNPAGLAFNLLALPYVNTVPSLAIFSFSIGNIPLLGGIGEGFTIMPDTMTGGDGNDILVSAGGNDTMDGGNGNDSFLIAGPGLKTVSGGDGADTIFYVIDISGAAGGLFVDGGAGDDTASAFIPTFEFRVPYDDAPAGPWFFDGGDGNDTLMLNRLFVGNLTFDGGAGNDTLTLKASSLYGLASFSQDPIEGLGITALGGDGDDAFSIEIAPPVGVPLGVSGEGDERLVFPDLTIDGGAGNDFIEIIGPRDTPVHQNIVVFGGDGDDTIDITGSRSASGRQVVMVDGGGGNDVVNGGDGADLLTGGTGADIFEYDTPNDGVDVITDFTPGDDVFHFDSGGFGGGLSPGALPADRFVSDSDPAPLASGTGVFLYDTDDGTLSWDSDGAAGNAAVTIAILSNTPALSASDFLIV